MGNSYARAIEAVAYANEIRFDALKLLGEMLKATERAKGTTTVGGGGRSGGTVRVPPENAPTLADLNLTKKESAVAQRIAALIVLPFKWTVLPPAAFAPRL